MKMKGSGAEKKGSPGASPAPKPIAYNAIELLEASGLSKGTAWRRWKVLIAAGRVTRQRRSLGHDGTESWILFNGTFDELLRELCNGKEPPPKAEICPHCGGPMEPNGGNVVWCNYCRFGILRAEPESSRA